MFMNDLFTFITSLFEPSVSIRGVLRVVVCNVDLF